jgi:hypothetical protein
MKQILLLLAVLVGLVVLRYAFDPPGEDVAVEENAGPSAYGFIDLPAEGKAGKKGIVVMAALNCPEDAAQRANYLTTQLEARGLPVIRTDGVSFRIENGDSLTRSRIQTVMGGEPPVVFVNGRAKSNPTYKEVLAEYGVGE